ncbi:hypothetical protein V6N12_031348 [Hibiscus sabdariffa]|uniref:Uncharacterized protein n=1 Tax=Hibiscus sabdariffa TaxID=183260 RepID=A0ABR2E8P6_9ROSI
MEARKKSKAPPITEKDTELGQLSPNASVTTTFSQIEILEETPQSFTMPWELAHVSTRVSRKAPLINAYFYKNARCLNPGKQYASKG